MANPLVFYRNIEMKSRWRGGEISTCNVVKSAMETNVNIWNKGKKTLPLIQRTMLYFGHSGYYMDIFICQNS